MNLIIEAFHLLITNRLEYHFGYAANSLLTGFRSKLKILPLTGFSVRANIYWFLSIPISYFSPL